MARQDLRLLRHSVETFGKGGMEKQWCLNVRRKLRDANRYLKTDFRVHYQPHNSTCDDQCRHFADPAEADFQQSRSHERLLSCDEFQGIKNVLPQVRLGIEGSCWIPYRTHPCLLCHAKVLSLASLLIACSHCLRLVLSVGKLKYDIFSSFSSL